MRYGQTSRKQLKKHIRRLINAGHRRFVQWAQQLEICNSKIRALEKQNRILLEKIAEIHQLGYKPPDIKIALTGKQLDEFKQREESDNDI